MADSKEAGEPIAQLRAAVGTLLLDSQASRAIVYSSLLEEHLKLGLSVKMTNINRSIEQTLFEGYGPLSTLNSKIDIAFALGILPEALFKNAHIIRKIRNKFAHSTKKLNFESETVIKLCKKLSTYAEGEQDLSKVYVQAVEALVEHLNNEFETGKMVHVLSESGRMSR